MNGWIEILMVAAGAVTAAGAAKILGVSVKTLKRHGWLDKIPHWTTPGGHRRYNEEDVLRFRANIGKQPEKPAIAKPRGPAPAKPGAGQNTEGFISFDECGPW